MMFVTLTLLLLASALLQAQSFEATVVGTVKDAHGAAIVGATVTITEDATGHTQSIKTNGQGDYTLLQLRPASYTITFEANGFKTYAQKNLVLETSQTARVTVTLQVGAKEDKVEVTAEAPAISLDQSKKGETIINKQVEDLPLNGRDFTDLASLVAGVYPRPSDDDQGQGLSSSGTRTDATNFTLDGVANRSDRNGSVGVNTSLDAIQEFNVSTSSFPAEYGKVAGAQITVVSKSGTNRMHGSLFDYVRTDLVDAQNYQGGASALRRQQFGGTLGGRIIKDRTFYFGSYEGSREAKSETAAVNAPNADWLGRGASGIIGDFSNLLSLTTKIGPDGRTECQRLYGQSGPHACQVGYNTGSGTGNFHAFPNNIIPANMISPIALKILQYIPVANTSYVPFTGSLEGYNADGLHDTNRNKFMLKLDHTLNNANALYVRWARQSGTEYDPFPSSRNYFPHMGSFGRSRYESVAFGDTHVISPSTLNEFRFGWYNQHNGTRAQNQDQDYATMFGIPGVSTDPYFMGFPQLRIDGYPEMGDRYNYPFTYEISNYQWYDALTMVRGKHTLKFGADITRSNYNEGGATYMRGDFRFRGRDSSYGAVTTPNPWSIADFLMGLPDATERETVTVPTSLTGWPMGFFAQDDWKVSSSLTLNVGLRWDVFLPFTEAKNRLANFIPSTGQVATAGDPNYPNSMLFTNWRNIQPRFGFAYHPFNSDKTVIRGGGGLFYSQETYNVVRQQLAQNPPYQNWELYGRDSSCPNPITCSTALTLANPWPVSLQKQPPLYGMDPHGKTPQIIQSNLTYEHEIIPDLTMELGYVGSIGHFLGRRYDINQGLNPTWNCSMGTDPATGQTNVATCKAAFASYPFPSRVTATGSAQSLTYQTQDANSNYHALQTSLRRRSKRGLTLLVSYTFSKMIDTTANTNNSTSGSQKYPQNSWDVSAERALSDLNRKHQFTASVNYELPIGRGKWLLGNSNGLLNTIVGNWQMNMKSSVLSGRPFTPQFNSADFTSERPDVVGDPMANVQAGFGFNPNAFAKPSDLAAAVYDWNFHNPGNLKAMPAVYGNAGRNSLIGPAFFTIDMGLSKNFKLDGLREGTRLQVRGEAFNLLNHPNFQIPNYYLDQPNAGEYKTMATDQRVFQFALKVLF
jgi:hypothetical protein